MKTELFVFYLIICYIFNQNYQRIPDSNSESASRSGEETIFERNRENEQPLLRDIVEEQFHLITQNNVSSDWEVIKIGFMVATYTIFFCVLIIKVFGI